MTAETSLPTGTVPPPCDPARPGISDATLKDAFRRHQSSGRASLGEMFGGHLEARSYGAVLETTQGVRFLNCAGYGVFLLGAAHPHVTEAVVAQVRRHAVSTRILLEPLAGRAAQAVAGLCPPGLEKVHFVGSGAEAAETAIKLARANGCTRLVTTTNGYHGKTLGALSLTARELYQAPFRPLLEGVVEVPYGDVAALEEVLADGRPSMFVVEPIQGEGGVVIPPAGYLSAVERTCREHGCLLAVDEVLTGLGRLGSWFGVDAEGVTPDIVLLGKALSGGAIPVAAAVTTEAVYRPFDKDPFLHTSTFSAAPVAMAAALAAVEALHAEQVVPRAAAMGAALLESIAGSAARHCPDLVKEVRGRGLLIGVEFRDAGLAGEAMLELVSRRILVNHSLNNSSVLRLTPPVVLDDEQQAVLRGGLDATFAALAEQFSTRGR